MKAADVQKSLAAVAGVQVGAVDYAARGFHVDVTLPSQEITAVVQVLDQEGFFIESITGVDWLGEQEALAKEAAKQAAAAKKAAEKAAAEAAEQAAGEAPGDAGAVAAPAAEPPPAPAPEESPEPEEDSFEVVYDFNHFRELCRVTIRVRVPRSLPELPSISDIYPGANWHEREAHDFFGLVFTGHPDLSPLLLPEDADFHPLRKDYKP
ncbi:NADH-quinone oxidoreductase subunit C [Desulfurivibrio dismutans]|uniref:NADH-quinone oxidoreductase subunit C n=1 Tax=Desulfurivibrio dismutans TaxID=1398908 RepID=UPI0023DC4BE0|nr:NADH-quinone oxidoreductase subunit C [Desulfurivibrio alkaliphilus]MDF1614017.1 NADH-quinone oxidoreductase subunit C [Desulfurivibrio alkaliphilus]